MSQDAAWPEEPLANWDNIHDANDDIMHVRVEQSAQLALRAYR